MSAHEHPGDGEENSITNLLGLGRCESCGAHLAPSTSHHPYECIHFLRERVDDLEERLAALEAV